MTLRSSRASVGPLAGRSVVVCRATEQARDLVAELESLGANVVGLPLIEVAEPIGGTDAMAMAGEDLHKFDWVVFTSANAVAAFVPHVRAWPATLQIAAVGPATAAAVKRVGQPVSFVPDEATAADLARSLPAGPRVDHPTGRAPRVLAPLAELASPDLVVGLQGRGFDVEVLVAYRTRVPEHDPSVLDAARDADAVLLASGSSVDRLVDLLGRDRVPPTLIAIGPSTARALTRRGLIATQVADPHTTHGLIAALLRSLA